MKTLLFLLCFTTIALAQYNGTASVTQGLATQTVSNLYSCTGGRIAALGTITGTDNTVWIVPAATNYSNANFPFASDLNNSCNSHNYANDTAALSALNGSDIVTVDADGEIITAFIFADNYFELYINGVQVGKDNVPFTQFNSNIVRFKVNRPFTIAMLLVDWEERLGVGGETNGGFNYHCGDGGMVAVFKDSNNSIIAKTGSDWKAQTFYTAPIMDLTCPTENGSLRLSVNCSTADSNSGSNYYGLHWARPTNWTLATFDDSSWPDASLYTNATIGVDNKPAYTNFTNIFDNPTNDAQFIWSTNVILDNEVIVRKKVLSSLSTNDNDSKFKQINLYPNPTKGEFHLDVDPSIRNEVKSIKLYNLLGELVFSTNQYLETISISNFSFGMYIVKVNFPQFEISKKLILK